MWWSGSVNGGFASQDAQLQCYADWLNAGCPDIQGQSAPDYLEEVKVTAQRVGIDELIIQSNKWNPLEGFGVNYGFQGNVPISPEQCYADWLNAGSPDIQGQGASQMPDNFIGGDGTAKTNILKDPVSGEKIPALGNLARVSDADHWVISSGYNTDRSAGTVHGGIDYVPYNSDGTVATDAKALSITIGKVVLVGPVNGFGDHTVVIRNSDNGAYITYGHMSAANVKLGDTVTRGTILGTIGSEGHSSGIHLHIQESYGAAFPSDKKNFVGFVDPD
jgi:murein DD-endopeptidase MepM/ murein hydrolase activator NlpD